MRFSLSVCARLLFFSVSILLFWRAVAATVMYDKNAVTTHKIIQSRHSPPQNVVVLIVEPANEMNATGIFTLLLYFITLKTTETNRYCKYFYSKVLWAKLCCSRESTNKQVTSTTRYATMPHAYKLPIPEARNKQTDARFLVFPDVTHNVMILHYTQRN